MLIGKASVRMRLIVYLIAALAVRASATPPESVEGDVVVYGATLSGCMAAISASRSGADKVVLATPYVHVGGMTTGGLQHADPGNEVRCWCQYVCPFKIG